MRLDYNFDVPDTVNPLVMTAVQGKRVELYLREDEDGSNTMLAYAGDTNAIEREMSQGPYVNRRQALAARKAIVGELLRKGYSLAIEALPIWALNAQRQIKAMREQKNNSKVNTQFDPKDVFLDW